jgi:ubiquinone/menaquinone biosynthesis C-methylase UbiE
MKPNNTNQWSLTKVAEAHGYLSESNQDEVAAHHNIFNAFLQQKKNPKICDIGCGNARILNNLSNYSKYLGIDVCEDLILSCKKHFKNNDKASFLAMDIEKYHWPKNLKEYDVAYLDSTFTMMENPQLLFKRLAKTFKTIFFHRTLLCNYQQLEIAKINHWWEGMDKQSHLWVFTPLFFSNFCASYGGECRAYPENVVVYERDKNFKDIIVYER